MISSGYATSVENTECEENSAFSTTILELVIQSRILTK